MFGDDEDTERVEVSVEACEVAAEELNYLIERTEGEEPDPLTCRIFQARNEFVELLEEER